MDTRGVSAKLKAHHMISVQIYVNETKIAIAAAVNKSNLNDLSNYEVVAVSEPSPVTGLGRVEHSFNIENHNRNQSAWALIEQIAKKIAEIENSELD